MKKHNIELNEEEKEFLKQSAEKENEKIKKNISRKERIKVFFKNHPKLYKSLRLADRIFSFALIGLLVTLAISTIAYIGKTGCSKTASADTKTSGVLGYEEINQQLVKDNDQAAILSGDKIYTGYIYPDDYTGSETTVDRTHGNLMIKISNVGQSLLFNNNIYLTLPIPYAETFNKAYSQLYYAVYPIQVYYYQTGIVEGLKKTIPISTEDFFSYSNNEFLYNMKHSEWTNTDVGFIEPDYSGDNITVHYSTTYYLNMGNTGLLEKPIYTNDNKGNKIKPAFTASFEILAKTVNTQNELTTEGKLYFSYVVYLLDRQQGNTYFVNSEGALERSKPTKPGVLRATVLKYKNIITNPFLNNPKTGEYFEIINGKKILSLSAVRGNSTSTTKVIFSTPGLYLTSFEFYNPQYVWDDGYVNGIDAGGGGTVVDGEFLVTFADNFLNYKFFGFFSIGTLLGIMFAVLFMVAFLKYFAGG